MKKSNLVVTAVVLLVIAGAVIFVASSVRESEIAIDGQVISFSGMFGTEVEVADILEVELRDTIPQTHRQISGSGLRGVRKGLYEIDEFDTARLFLHVAEGPFIILHTTDEVIIINYKDAEKTRAHFEEILDLANKG